MLEKLSMILLSETCPRMVLFSIMGQIGGMFILYWMLGKTAKAGALHQLYVFKGRLYDLFYLWPEFILSR